MKLWFDWNCNDNTYSDSNVKLGIGWYRHHKDHKWWGLSVEIYLFSRYIAIHYVSDYDAYDRKINRRKYK